MKPYFLEDSIRKKADSVSMVGKKLHSSWFMRKLFDEHLLEFRRPDFSVTADVMPSIFTGKDVANDRSVWTNSRGFQVQLDIGKKVYIYSYLYETQSLFPEYISRHIQETKVVPGQGRPANFQVDVYNDSKNFDYPIAGGYLSYTPNKFLNVMFGQDKNFIGDGYRSMLLSDVSTNYPFLKINLTLDNVRYMSMWAQFQDPSAPQFSYDNGFRRKWGVFHYLDWNLSRKFSAGFFDAVIWQDADSTSKRGFDVNYLNPFAFLRPVEFNLGSPDNALIGFNLKYNVTNSISAYGQLALDEFRLKELFSNSGWWANKYGVQLGIKANDFFKVPKLNVAAEFNTARPYTYSARSSLQNFGNYNEPLAHPYGANFKEVLGIMSYQYRAFQVRGQMIYASYGIDPANANYGGDILKSYVTRTLEYGNDTGQGINTRLYYGDLKLAWMMNPRINLRLEGGLTLRSERNRLGKNEAALYTIGVKSSFRNLYFDF
ncbi:hypothetical protein [Hufsiella ginkgonis]|uniref:Gliding motility protein RemB n=1 Tax=Hufsiella ginkgonis TaxID=2695274 RepID=A0A7K1Y274_9SPHI|nr:hypothetical protein [Hufsiella ginkgonis]MXV17370.1 hypothetical protein [Hufsiella ginkgonis]